ncbi:unnamed protein product [Mytilus coruscus]|uniref:Ig-like domain-containing protein n=1 Tax=Mytilus coruscus TaxID=42192 RepID=A0A6J8CKG6_MYTCO|nr:unnamed protein product [Mytilus coruscus]
MQAIVLLICLCEVTVAWANDDTQCKQPNKTINTLLTTVGSTNVLKCRVSQQTTSYTWENGETIAEKEIINPSFQHLNKFTINRTLQEYNLKISNISTADGGKYCCEQKCFQFCVQLCVIEAPEVSVIQLDDGSLLCNASGFPDNYSFSRWEHKSPTGKHLRYLNGTENGILNFDTLDGNIGLTYSLDGIYVCKIGNRMAEYDERNFQSGFTNVMFKGKPECLGKTVETAHADGSIKIQVDVYSSSKLTFNLLESEVDLPVKQSPKHKVTITESQTMVEMYNHQVHLNSTNIILEISDVDQQDTNSYRLEVSNNHGTSYCTVILPKGRKGSRKFDKVILAILSCGSAGFVLLIVAIILMKIGKHRVSKKTQKRENICYHRHEKQFNTYSMAKMRNEVFEEVTLNMDERDKGKRFTICSVVQDV